MKVTDPPEMMFQTYMASENYLNLWPWLMFKELLIFNVKNNELDMAIVLLSSN